MEQTIASIELASVSLQASMFKRRELLALRDAGRPYAHSDLWLYTQLAQESASILAGAYRRLADSLLEQAIDALPEGT